MTWTETGRVSAFSTLVVVGLFLLAGLTLYYYSASRSYGWPQWAFCRILYVVPVALLALSSWQKRPCLAPRWGEVCLTTIAILYMVAATVSVHPGESWSLALPVVSLCALVVVVARETSSVRFVPPSLAVGGVVYCIASVLAWVVSIVVPEWLGMMTLNAEAGDAVFSASILGPRNPLLLGHWNYTGGAGLLALPWVILYAWRSRGWLRGAWLIGLLFVFAAIYSATSRGAWLGVAASGVIAVVVLGIVQRWSRRQMILVLLTAPLMAAAVILIVPRLRATVAGVIAGQGFNRGDEQRLNMLLVGGMMVRERPWIGHGPGLTTRLYPAYRERVDGGVETAFQLHSTPLQIAVDAGLGAMLLAGALVFGALCRCVQSLRRRAGEAGKRVWFQAAAGASVTGYVVMALTDYQLDVPWIAAMVGTALGLLLQRETSQNSVDVLEERDLTDWVYAIVTTGVLIGFAGLSVLEGRGRRMLAEGLASVGRGEPIEVFDEAAFRAVECWPDDPQPLVAAALVHLQKSFSEKDSVASARHRGAAVHFFSAALAIEPTLEIAHLNLGWLLLGAQPGEAALHFRMALELVPDRGGVYFGLGLARLATGERERGIDAIALEVLSDPRFVTSPVWDRDSLREFHKPVVRRAITLAEEFEARFDAEQRRSLDYTAQLLRWLSGESLDSSWWVVGPSETRSFFALGEGGPSRSINVITRQTPAWVALETAYMLPERRETVVKQLLYSRTHRRPTPQELEIVLQLLTNHGLDFLAWLNAPQGRTAPFSVARRKHRDAYATLARNPDLPTPIDAFVAEENGLVEMFFSPIFPERGHLPESRVVRYVRERDL